MSPMAASVWVLLLLALGLLLWGAYSLKNLRRRTVELARQEQALFLYEQYYATALQNWSKAERAMASREWAVAEEAWLEAVQCLEKASTLANGSRLPFLKEELEQARRRLGEVQGLLRQANGGAKGSSLSQEGEA